MTETRGIAAASRVAAAATAAALVLGLAAVAPQATAQPNGEAPNSECTIATFLPSNPDATAETIALYQNMKALEGTAHLFGHQDTLAYGAGWWEDGTSDIYEVTGAYPAVMGFDVGRLELGWDENIDGVNFGNMQAWIREGHAMGSIITLSWHSVNPITQDGYGNNVSPDAIEHVLPGGSHHDVLVDWLDSFAAFNKGLVDEHGNSIPIVFRPYHEHSGDWFWWGVDSGVNTIENFVELWRFSYDYLHDAGANNLLWAISPDRSRLSLESLAAEYLEMYPGDDYVDIMGIDNYWDTGSFWNSQPMDQQFQDYIRTMEIVSQLAQEHNMIAALTETGEAGHQWTEYLLEAFTANEGTQRILWSLIWRNAHDGHRHGPYPGGNNDTDFVEFYEHSFTMFNDTLPDVYSRSVTVRSLQQLIDCLAEDGTLGRPLSVQLGNHVDLAARHLASGRTTQAVRALENAQRHLGNPARGGDLADAAVRTVIERDLEIVASRLRTG